MEKLVDYFELVLSVHGTPVNLDDTLIVSIHHFPLLSTITFHEW